MANRAELTGGYSLWLFGALAFGGLVLLTPGCRNSTHRRLTVSIPHTVDSLDPHARDWIGSQTVAWHFYEPLVTVDTHLNPRPCLATHWDNPDLLTWVFHIRPGVRFHSGAILTAADVVYSFERVLKSSDLELGGYANGIAGVREMDALTVEIRTRRPMAVFLKRLRMVLIVPKGAGRDTLAASVNGTGPYRLEAWKSGEEVRMVRSDVYWGAKPAVAQVTFRLGRDPEAAIEDIRTGRSGLVQCNAKKLEAAVSGLRHVSVLRHYSSMVKFLAYDVARDKTPFCDASSNPFKSRDVRCALSAAIDRQRLASSLSTFAMPVSQPVPPFIFGFNPTLPEATTNIAQARFLLEKAGFGTGFRVTLHTRKVLAETADVVKRQLAAVGVEVTVQVLPDPEYFQLVMGRKASFYLSRFSCSTGDVSDILDDAVHSRDESRRLGASNNGGYSESEVDRLIEESNETLDVEKRSLLLRKISSTTREDQMWIPLYVDQDGFALSETFDWLPRFDGHILGYEVGIR